MTTETIRYLLTTEKITRELLSDPPFRGDSLDNETRKVFESLCGCGMLWLDEYGQYRRTRTGELFLRAAIRDQRKHQR